MDRAHSRARVNVEALYAALDKERTSQDWSWRHLAKEIGVSPSLLSRLRNGYRPDADGFVTLVNWLNVPAEQFVQAEGIDRRQPELTTQLAPLLRARKDLSTEDIAYLEAIVEATMRRARDMGAE